MEPNINGFTQRGIENALRRFPLIDTHDKELNLPPIPWNIGILVDRLIGIKETLKEFRKVQKKGYELAIVTNNRTNGFYTVLVPPASSDEALGKVIDDGMRKKGIDDYSWKRYRTEDDLEDFPNQSKLTLLRNAHRFKTKIKAILYCLSPRLAWRIGNYSKR